MNSDTAASLATMLLVAVTIAITLVVLTTTGAPATTVCLTKKEAHQLWPRAHIYWYSSDHCWSNRRGGPPRGIKVDPIPDKSIAVPLAVKDARAEASKPKYMAPLNSSEPLRVIEDGCCWPALTEFDLRWSGVKGE